MPELPNDGDVIEAVAQAYDAIAGVVEGEFFMARAMDGGIRATIFKSGDIANRNEALRQFVATGQAYVSWAPPVAVEARSDPRTGEIHIAAGFRLSTDAVVADAPPANRALRLRSWGAAEGT